MVQIFSKRKKHFMKILPSPSVCSCENTNRPRLRESETLQSCIQKKGEHLLLVWDSKKEIFILEDAGSLKSEVDRNVQTRNKTHGM